MEVVIKLSNIVLRLIFFWYGLSLMKSMFLVVINVEKVIVFVECGGYWILRIDKGLVFLENRNIIMDKVVFFIRL